MGPTGSTGARGSKTFFTGENAAFPEHSEGDRGIPGETERRATREAGPLARMSPNRHTTGAGCDNLLPPHDDDTTTSAVAGALPRLSNVDGFVVTTNPAKWFVGSGDQPRRDSLPIARASIFDNELLRSEAHDHSSGRASSHVRDE
ncbi:hypothetical protein [Actinopolyspora erythraea]|uniref:hypothetical protein n=1 Tax=Actinopolyspora erythraea TaxID=414996 RepID=UPI001186CEB7|nr:hypothetical protein [Actinopolyspora erythraea]